MHRGFVTKCSAKSSSVKAIRHVRTSTLVCKAQSVQNPTHLKALREWSVINASIQDGLQTVLLRKGGIEEKGFRLEAKSFMLFPSYFHADNSLLKPGILERYEREMAFDPKTSAELHLRTYAEVTGMWITKDLQVAGAVEEIHVGMPAFLDKRLKWRRGQDLTILELRSWKLEEAVVVTVRPEYFGCFSWIDLDLQTNMINKEAMQPSLPDATFRVMQNNLRAQLSKLKDVKEISLN
ncbi:hypothetical protein CEUSTIGMA_g9764.t1 [Chlamydomonas eustigma]|uniref:Uncharacterized protein n=1 Tax=Chlamydomonas eustigma TaxID=1157962 RepID=A0A250XGX4_9CHLO|nr:hypothetical protein CEUSTIGMA_g9764.t1 [Chlamydomonas eustigma]|eukprot:GAX82335.1 hypothetical protein CEUSTIGMA_g9764.t1 [Chlamydomonas eustigma]